MNDAVCMYMICLMIEIVISFSESSPEKQSEHRDRKPFIAKYWDFRGSNVEEFQQIGTSDKNLQNHDSDAGKYFLHRNTEIDVKKDVKTNKVKRLILYNTI